MKEKKGKGKKSKRAVKDAEGDAGAASGLAERLETQRTRVVCGPEMNYHVRASLTGPSRLALSAARSVHNAQGNTCASLEASDASDIRLKCNAAIPIFADAHSLYHVGA